MAGKPNLNDFQPESWKTKAGKIGSSLKSSKKETAPPSNTVSPTQKLAAAKKPSTAASKQSAAPPKKQVFTSGADVKKPPRDWTREKEGAAKAGTAVKSGVVTGAMATRDGSVKAYGWLASKFKGKGETGKGNSQLSGH